MGTLSREILDSVIGVNPGKGFLKGRCGKRYLSKTPSIMANMQEGLEFDGFGKSDDDLIIEYEGERYAIGYSAMRHNRVAEANRGGDRITSDYFKILFLGMLTELAPPDRRRTSYEPESIVMIAPINSYQNERDQIKAALAGDYEVGIVKGGEVHRWINYTIREDALRVIPEGFGTIADMTITDEGIAHDPKGYSRPDATIGIINCGTGTTDLMFFEGMRLVPAKCDGRDIGISNVWDDIRKWARKNYNKELNDYQVDEALDRGYFMVGNQPIDLHEYDYINTVLGNTAAQVVNFVASTWSDGKDCEFLLTSGGAGGRFHRFIVDAFSHAECVPQPIHSEANGAYKYGLLRLRNELEQV